MNIRLLFLPLSIVVFLWVTIGFTKSNWDQYRQTKKEVKELTVSRDKLARGVSKIRKALADYKALDEETLLYVNNALPEKKKAEDLVAELNKNASQGGVLLTKVTVAQNRQRRRTNCSRKSGTASAKSGARPNCVAQPDSLQVRLTLFSSYLSAKNFLAKLDKENRVILPVALRISKNTNKQQAEENKDKLGEGGTGEDLVSTDLRFNIFYKKPRSENLRFSQMLGKDKVLDSLLSKGLAKDTIDKLKEVVGGQLFRPVEVGNTGKEDLFKKNS